MRWARLTCAASATMVMLAKLRNRICNLEIESHQRRPHDIEDRHSTWRSVVTTRFQRQRSFDDDRQVALNEQPFPVARREKVARNESILAVRVC
jgi:hypothetical protein